MKVCMMPFPNPHTLSPFRDALRNERPQDWPSLVPPSPQQEESAWAERTGPGQGRHRRGLFLLSGAWTQAWSFLDPPLLQRLIGTNVSCEKSSGLQGQSRS